MKPKKAIVEKAIANGAMNRVNKLIISSAFADV